MYSLTYTSQTEEMKQPKADFSSTKSQLTNNQKWVITVMDFGADC